MSAWGTAVFSDDNAVDIRDDFKDLIGEGLNTSDATQKLILEWHELLNDPEDASIFWIALALTQWQTGRVEQEVNKKAIEAIDSGTDLARWQEPERKKRQKVLEKTKATLLSTPPKPKKISKPFKQQCEWAIGEIIAYKTISEKLILLRLASHHIDKGGKTPTFQLLDWIGKDVPPKWRIHFLKVKIHKFPKEADIDCFSMFSISSQRENDIPVNRIIRTKIKSKPVHSQGMIIPWYSWDTFDDKLKLDFDIQ